MKSLLLVSLWVSWVLFCSVFGLLGKLIPYNKNNDFELGDTVCGTLHSKGLMSKEDYSFEMEQANKHNSTILLGYWTLVAPIMPMLKSTNIINGPVLYFTNRWVKHAKQDNSTSNLVLSNSKNIGETASKLANFFTKYPLLLRFSPILSLLGIVIVNLLIDTPHYALHLITALYSVTFFEVISGQVKAKINHTKAEVYITSIGLIVTYFILVGKAESLGILDTLQLAVMFGFIQGSLGFVLGHEIGHKSGLENKVLSKLLFTMAGYSQFWEVHNKLHHRMIGTSLDMSTAKKGQALFNYLRGQARLYWDNLGLYNLIAMVFLAVALKGSILFVLTVMVVSWSLLEVINFIQHYGLTRTSKLDEHLSWDTENIFSNAFLFNLGRHGHHHKSGAKWHSDLEFKSMNRIEEGYFLQTFTAIAGA